MGRFINGDRPRSSPRLNLVKPARFDAYHKELVNGVKQKDTEAKKEDENDIKERPKKKIKINSRPKPIRRSSRKIVLMKTKSSGVVTRSHHKQKGQKQPDVHNGTQPAHKNGLRRKGTTTVKSGKENMFADDRKEAKPKSNKKSVGNPTPLRRGLRNMSAPKKKLGEVGK